MVVVIPVRALLASVVGLAAGPRPPETPPRPPFTWAEWKDAKDLYYTSPRWAPAEDLPNHGPAVHLRAAEGVLKLPPACTVVRVGFRVHRPSENPGAWRAEPALEAAVRVGAHDELAGGYPVAAVIAADNPVRFGTTEYVRVRWVVATVEPGGKESEWMFDLYPMAENRRAGRRK